MSVIKNISYFLAALVFARAVGFLQSFILARALGPESYGVWVTLLLIVTYSPIISLGSVETLVKKVPYFLGRKEMEHLREVESSVMGSLILSASVLVLLAVAALVALPLTPIKFSRYLAALWLVTIAISYFSAYFYQRFIAYENFKVNGGLDALRSVLAVVFVGGLGWIWGLKGAVFGFFLSECSICGVASFLSVRSYGLPGVTFRKDLMVTAVRIGFPITLLLWVLGLSVSVDRVVLGSMLGAKSVGYYGLGFSLAAVLGLLPVVVGRVLYPKVNKQFGENPDPESMKRLVLAPTLALGTLSVNMQAALVVAAPVLYCVLLPKYQLGLLAGQILIIGSFFGTLLQTGRNYLVATNQEKVFLKYIGATLVFNVVFDVSLVRAGFGTEGVAVGTSLAGFLLTCLIWRRAFIGLGITGRALWMSMAGLFLPIVVLTVAFFLLEVLCPAILQQASFSLIPVGLLLLVAMNGVLLCFPVYRNEMIGWKERLLWHKRKFLLARGFVKTT